jgi:3-isopropylmalate dehydratase small subunit
VSGLDEVGGGRAWTVGESIDTNQLAGGGVMGATAEETLRLNCLRAVRPDFPGGVRPGDVLVAGRNFGCGSSRQTAVEALALCGVGAVVVESVARIFRRNCIAVGLPLFVVPGVRAIVEDGDIIEIEYARRVLTVPRTGASRSVQPWSQGVEEIYAGGGLANVIASRLTALGHHPQRMEAR